MGGRWRQLRGPLHEAHWRRCGEVQRSYGFGWRRRQDPFALHTSMQLPGVAKGDCMNAFVGAECGDSSTKSQEICVTAVPGAQFSCDPTTSAGKYQFYNLTEEEISALTDCHYVTP